MYFTYIQGMIGQDILVCMLIIGNIRTDISTGLYLIKQ